MKKTLSILLALILMFTLSISALANTPDDGVFVTQEMIEQDREALAEFVKEGAAIRAMAAKQKAPTTKKLNIPLQLQNNSTWAELLFPCGHDTYANIGCAMTCYAMISQYYNNNGETPVTFAKKYYGTGKLDPCNQDINTAVAKMKRSKTAGKGTTQEEVENSMIAAIRVGKPVMARVDYGDYGSHYFVAYGYYITSEGSATIYIRDPEGRVGGTVLSDYYPSYELLSYAIIN